MHARVRRAGEVEFTTVPTPTKSIPRAMRSVATSVQVPRAEAVHLRLALRVGHPRVDQPEPQSVALKLARQLLGAVLRS